MVVMNPEVKAKWLAALRSGDYQQGRSALAQNGQYCCLGVLCELAVQEDVISKYTTDEATYYGKDVSEDNWAFEGNSSYLPKAVAEWAGLFRGSDTNWGYNYSNPGFRVDGGEVKLSHLNDAGSSFQVIADKIEQNF